MCEYHTLLSCEVFFSSFFFFSSAFILHQQFQQSLIMSITVPITSIAAVSIRYLISVTKKFCLMCSPKSVPSTQSKCLHITVKPWIGLTQKLLNWNATVSPILLLVLLYCYLATRAANEMWRIGWAHHASNKHSFSKNLKCNQHINLHFQLKWCNDCTCTTMPSKNFRQVSLCLSFPLWLNLRLQCLETTGWTSGRASSCQKYRSSNFQRFLCKTSGNHQLTQVN